MSETRALEKLLNCFSYFGFASGYSMAQHLGPNPAIKQMTIDVGDRGLYCNAQCPLSKPCWDAHRDRVRVLMPELTKLADEIAKTYHGHAYMVEWFRQTGQATDGPIVEPFLNVLFGNVEDGAAVGEGGRPKDRGPGTLPWPFPRTH